MDTSPIVRLKYFLRIKNVGDRIAPDLLAALFGLRTKHYGADDAPHLIATGSLVAAATRQSHLWGTGLMFMQDGVGHAAAKNIHALRGKLTFAALRQAGLAVTDVPLGDPAYLICDSALHRRMPKKYRLGLVAHYVDRRNPRVQRLLADDGVADLNVHDDPDAFLTRMAECETVASSSLHGLIFAEALGIPNVWLELSDQVAGGGFKFHDWFSTTARPQVLPFSPHESDAAGEYIKRAELHDCQIDTPALVAAFPRDELHHLEVPPKPGRAFVSLSECRSASRPIPIFIISYNRPYYLLRAVKSYLALDAPVQIVIHDNGSDDKRARDLLDELEQMPRIRVVRSGKVYRPDELNGLNATVADFFAPWAEPSRYVVSDCDIDLSATKPDALNIYGALLDVVREAECAGPMLTVRDIASDYPLRNEVMNRHVKEFWQRQPEWVTVSGTKVAVLRQACIDTTFALHRAGEPFRRLKFGVRVYFPYEAKHLDWYEPSPSEAYSSSAAPDIAHWASRPFFKQFRDALLEYETLTYVEADEAGSLIAKTMRITPGPKRDNH